MWSKHFSFKVNALVILIGVHQLFYCDFAKAEKSEFAIAVDLVKQKNYIEAYKLFAKLSEFNDHDAQFNAALLLKKGLGHPTNYKLALKWISLADLGGLKRAADIRQEVLSLVPLETAAEVHAEIKEILQTRLDSGDVSVCLQFAKFYLEIIDEPDYKTAYALRSVATALNVPGASKLRNQIQNELEAADLIESQALAAKLFNETRWQLDDD